MLQRILLLFVLMFSLGGNAQSLLEKRVNFSCKDIKLVEVLEQLNLKLDNQLSYSINQLPSSSHSCAFQNERLKIVLRHLLDETSLDFQVVSGNVVLFKRYAPPKKIVYHTLSGYVSDIATGERLIGANVYSPGRGFGDGTNEYGFFSLTLPADSLELEVSYLGYTTTHLSLNLQKDELLDIQLELNSDMEVIEVVGEYRSPVDLDNKGKMTVDYNPSGNQSAQVRDTDPIRLMTYLPGVQSGAGGLAGMYVRGGSFDQNLFLLDGVSVYNPTHLLGLQSIFNADALNKVSLRKSNFPSKVGGRLSSVMDVRMREGDNRQFSGKLSLGLLTSNVLFEGPIVKNKTSIMLAARRTYLDFTVLPILQNLINDENFTIRSKYFFYDINAKLNHEFSKNDKLYISYYRGNEKVNAEIIESGLSLSGGKYESNSVTGIDWGNSVLALRWNHLFKDKLFSNLTANFTEYKFSTLNSTYSLTNSFIGDSISTISSSYNLYESKISDVNVNIDLEYMMGPQHQLSFGGGTTLHYFSPGFYNGQIQIEEALDFETFKDSLLRPALVEETEGGLDIANGINVIAYLQDHWTLSKVFDINYGLRANAFLIGKANYINFEPRFNFHWDINKAAVLSGGATVMAQNLHLLSPKSVGLPSDIWVYSTEKVGPEKSVQFYLKNSWNIKNDWQFSLEGYYKLLNNVVGFGKTDDLLISDAGWEDEVLIGEGKAYGAEFLVKKSKGKTTGWVAYTLSWSLRRFNNLNDGEWFPFQYDRRHYISAVINHKFGPKVELGATWNYGSGHPVTAPNGTYQVNSPYGPITILNYDRVNNVRLEDVHRLDILVHFKKETRFGQSVFSIGVFNAYNRLNPIFLVRDRGETFDSTNVSFSQVGLLPILPIIRYSVRFYKKEE